MPSSSPRISLLESCREIPDTACYCSACDNILDYFADAVARAAGDAVAGALVDAAADAVVRLHVAQEDHFRHAERLLVLGKAFVDSAEVLNVSLLSGNAEEHLGA